MDTVRAREHAFKLIYEIEIKTAPPTDVLELFFATHNLGDKSQQYITNIVNASTNLNEKIEPHLRSWALSRVSKIALSAIKLAIAEIQTNPKITQNIAISEAVRLADVFEGQEAANFANGVLGAMFQ